MLDPGRLGKRFPEYYQVMRFLTIPALSVCFFLAAATDTPPGTVQFRTHVIESNIPGGYSVIVANSKAYGGGMFVVPHSELDDGLLDVMLSGASSKLHFLRSLPKLFNGSHVDDPNLRFIRGEEVQVSADRPFMVYADGDPIGELPVHVRVARQALRVLVPAS